MKSLKQKAAALGLPELPDKCTMGDKYRTACEKVKTKEQADVWFEIIVKHNMTHSDPPHSREQAEDIERQNIGYFAGYYDSDVAQRVYQLFNCEHPIFGKIQPTPEQSLKAGMLLGETMKNSLDVQTATQQVREKMGLVDSAHETLRKTISKEKQNGNVRRGALSRKRVPDKRLRK